MTADKSWQQAKESYLQQVEHALSQSSHPRRVDVLTDVAAHLDRRRAELSEEQQNWDNYQRIITEMGPPEEYAELLDGPVNGDVGPKDWIWKLNRLLAVFFAGAVVGIGIFLVVQGRPSQPAGQEPAATSPSQTQIPPNRPAVKAFVGDSILPGKWQTVDFVKKIEDFKPDKRYWQGDLSLKDLEFYPMGRTSGPWLWSSGRIIQPEDDIEAVYFIRNLNGEFYLFFPWISGDVIDRGMKPRYYVLKKTETTEGVKQ